MDFTYWYFKLFVQAVTVVITEQIQDCNILINQYIASSCTAYWKAIPSSKQSTWV